MSTGTIDEALEVLEGAGPEYAGGLANHGPMAAEALYALGRGDAAPDWARGYRKRLQEAPAASRTIERAEWRESLGKNYDVGAWIAFFDRELSEASWRDVVAEWVPALAPGLITAALHGVIRVAHAARSLESSESPLRLKELAQGFGYWAARYQELGSAPVDAGSLLPSQALGEIEKLPAEKRITGGSISAGLMALRGDETFPETANMVATNADASEFISDLTRTFAGVYLANSNDWSSVITFVHSVTGPSALRLLLPHLPAKEAPRVLRHGWHAAAGLYAAFATGGPAETADGEIDREDLIDRSIATEDEHAIKFTEACLRENAIRPDPVDLAAAAHAADFLRGDH